MSTQIVHASALSLTSFDQLAAVCAPGISIATLRAVASVESHFQPYALRDNSAHQLLKPVSLLDAVYLANERLERGHSLDLGLMQINAANLANLGMRVQDAFDPCRSLAAASTILLRNYEQASTETERQAATLIALSRYNTGRPLVGVANGYLDKVLAAVTLYQASPSIAQKFSTLHARWSVWGAPDADQASWLVTVDGDSEIKRAGAQTSDARREGRAPAISSEKGEPYEVSAYRDSEALRQ
jgi:type IV secretion system protein VirB1